MSENGRCDLTEGSFGASRVSFINKNNDILQNYAVQKSCVCKQKQNEKCLNKIKNDVDSYLSTVNQRIYLLKANRTESTENFAHEYRSGDIKAGALFEIRIYSGY